MIALVLAFVLVSPNTPFELQEPTGVLSKYLTADVSVKLEVNHIALRDGWRVICRTNQLGAVSEDLRDAGIMPAIWSYRLCLLRCDGAKWLIQSPKDMQGMVQLSSVDDAEEYLRAFRNVYTVRLCSQYRYVEVSPSRSAPNTVAHASYDSLNAAGGLQLEESGRADGKAYVFERFLLWYSAPNEPVRVDAVVERITAEGHYEMLVLGSWDIDGDVGSRIQLPTAHLPR